MNISQESEVQRKLFEAAEKLVSAKSKSLLLVEDSAPHAALIHRALSGSSWQITHVTRASEARNIFIANPNHIVLLDLSLPDTGGLELLIQLKKINASVPAIVVTSLDNVQSSVEAMQKGACDYVVKSDPKESIKRIYTAIERAWNERLTKCENEIIEQSKLLESIRKERIYAVEQIVESVWNEVSNPLSGVMLLSEVLGQQKDLNHDLQKLVDGINKSATQVAEAVQKLKKAASSTISEQIDSMEDTINLIHLGVNDDSLIN